MKKELSPRDAKSLDEICSLQTDNCSTKDAWIIITDGDHVTIQMQRNGESSTGAINIKKSNFNRLIDWYNRPQKKRNR